MGLSEEDLEKLTKDKLKSDLVKQCVKENGFFSQPFNHDGYTTHHYCTLISQDDPKMCVYAMNNFVICENGKIMRKCEYHWKKKKYK